MKLGAEPSGERERAASVLGSCAFVLLEVNPCGPSTATEGRLLINRQHQQSEPVEWVSV